MRVYQSELRIAILVSLVCLSGVVNASIMAGANTEEPRTPWTIRSRSGVRSDKGAVSPAIDIPPVPDVSDPVLAYLISMLEAHVYDTLTAEEIHRGSRGSQGKSLIPLEHLKLIGHGFGQRQSRLFTTIELIKEQIIPAPYSLLGYHPGSVIVPERVVLREWYIGDLTIRERRRKKLVKIKECYLWALESGTVWVDIDGWVDALLGGRVDDIAVNSLALFRLEGLPYAMAMGFNRDGEGRSGALDLRKNELVFPTPWQLKTAGKFLRRRALRRLELESHAMPNSP